MDLYPSLYTHIHMQSLTQSPSNKTSASFSRKGVKSATSYKIWEGSEACGCQGWSSGNRQMEMQKGVGETEITCSIKDLSTFAQDRVINYQCREKSFYIPSVWTST